MSKVTGINHILLTVKDMNRSVDFFCNILGLTVKGTAQMTMNKYPGPLETGAKVKRLYFLQATDGTMIVCAETPDVHTDVVNPVLPAYWPDSDRPAINAKVDHVALNVESRDDLVHLQTRLREHGVKVSEINERDSTPKFVKSIYFRSPDGLPMEICTWDWSDPSWEAAAQVNYMTDPDPVPSLKEVLERQRGLAGPRKSGVTQPATDQIDR
ncbi:hypothetical protein BH09PSE5_BH09PSE5_11940 [soil metagenome]